jgi:hypothetical protein
LPSVQRSASARDLARPFAEEFRRVVQERHEPGITRGTAAQAAGHDHLPLASTAMCACSLVFWFGGSRMLAQLGGYVNVGQRSVSVVNADSFWVDGYFEEASLKGIREGDRASIKLDLRAGADEMPRERRDRRTRPAA